MFRRSILTGLALATCFLQMALAAEGPLGTFPKVPVSGEPFQILHKEDVAEAKLRADDKLPASAVKHKWTVTVSEGEHTFRSPRVNGLPAKLPEAPALKVAKAKPGATYTFALRRTEDEVTTDYVLLVKFGPDGADATFPAMVMPEAPAADPDAEAPETPPAPMPGATGDPASAPKTLAMTEGETAKPAAEKPVAGDTAAVTESLATVPNPQDLIVSFDFIKARLTDGGADALWDRIKKPKKESDAVLAAMSKAAQLSEGKSGEEVLAIWRKQRDALLQTLEKDVPVTNKTLKAWSKFLEAWETEALKAGQDRLREAIQQSGPIIAALIMKLNDDHIKAALKQGNLGTSSSPSSGSGASGDSVYFHHHAHMPFLRMKVRRIDEMRRMRVYLQQ
jgi:hypothetical protein